MDRGEVTEVWASACRLWVCPGDNLHAEHSPELLPFARCANDATNRVSLSQADAAQHGRRNVDIVRTRKESVASNESVSIINDLKDPFGPNLALLLSLRCKDLLDHVREIFLL